MKRIAAIGLALSATTAAAGETAPIMGGSVSQVFTRGGPVMWPILVCSILAMAMFLERLFALRSVQVVPAALLREARKRVAAGRADEAAALCARDPSPLGRMLHACLAHAHAGVLQTEAALEAAGSRELYDLRRNIRALPVIADAATLLGLLGTVLGMILAFDAVARLGALGRTERLAEGVGQALLTTVFGLIVAIPTLLGHQFLRGRADDLVRGMEDICLDLSAQARERAPAAASEGGA
jgi:biopolymer transport protein ExbB